MRTEAVSREDDDVEQGQVQTRVTNAGEILNAFRIRPPGRIITHMTQRIYHGHEVHESLKALRVQAENLHSPSLERAPAQAPRER